MELPVKKAYSTRGDKRSRMGRPMGLFKTAVCTLLLSVPFTAQSTENPDPWPLLRGRSPAQQTELAIRYEHGEGVARNYTLAMNLYCAAALSGYAVAQYQLGWMYANGRGIQRDDEQAAAWFRLAATGGDAYALRMLTQVDDPSRPRRTPRCILPPDPTLKPATRLAKQFLLSPERREIEALVRRLAPQYKLDPELVLAVIAAESAFQINARSPKNALGLMQLIPDTARRFGVADPLDPVQNLQGGMAYLRWLLAYFQGNVRLALAGYNAGEGAVLKYGGIPPYAETRAYVQKITQVYSQPTHPPVELAVAPAALLAARP